jgi:hypothetical protein
MNKLITIFFLFSAFSSYAQNNLDKITGFSSTTASVAYSLRLLSSNYSGPLVRIKVGTNFYDVYPESTSNKFSLSSKISASISTYNAGVAAASGNALTSIITAGTTNATVAIWYDQSGNGVHVYSINATAKIITAGSIQTLNGQPTVKFSTTDSFFESTSTVNYSSQSGATVSAIAQNAATSSFGGIIGTANGISYPGYNTSYSSGVGYQSDANGCGYGSNVITNDPKMITSIFINTTTNLSKIYVNGVLKTNTAVTTNTCSLTHTSGSKIYIGAARGVGSYSFNGNISEAIIFPNQMSTSNQTLLETNQTAFYFSPFVTITSSASGAVCAGTSVTFTATPYNFTGTPTYQWYKNGAVISGETNATYTTSTLANADQIYVKATPGYTSGSISTSNLIANFDAANYTTTSTRWNDLSSSANHMDFYTSTSYSTLKTATYSTDGGGSLNLNNNSVYGKTINNTGISGNGGKTMSAWVKFDATDQDWTSIASIGEYVAGKLFEIYAQRNGTSSQLIFHWSGSQLSNYADLPKDTWYYVTIKSDGSSNNYIYINGVQVGSATQALNTTNSPLYMGAPKSYSQGGWNYNLRGRISTLSLYNASLSAQTILDNYNATKGRYTVSSVSSSVLSTTITAGPSAVVSISGDGCINKTTLSTPTGLSYAWYKDNAPISGATSNTYLPSTAGDYKVQVTSGSCSTISAATTISVCGVTADGRMRAITSPTTLVSHEGGVNFGTGVSDLGTTVNATGISTTLGTIGATTAVVSGVISSTNARTTSIGVIYSTDSNFGTYSTSSTQSNVAAGAHAFSLTGLSATTNYFAKSFIVNKAGISYGSVVNFTTSSPPKAVGDYYGDGIIFYILKDTDIGYDANVQHGLIAKIASSTSGSTAPGGTNGELIAEDPGSGWTSNGLTTFTGATGDALFAGKSNTTTIISVLGTTSAAYSCANYRSLNYNDWYMPSSWELDLLLYYHITRMSAGGSRLYTGGNYISSTDKDQLTFKTYYSDARGGWDGPQNSKATQRSRGLIPIRSF